jgi:hypothetical protein
LISDDELARGAADLRQLSSTVKTPGLAPTGTPPATTDMRWIDELIMSDSARAAEGARVKTLSSAPTRDAAGLDHYARQVGASSVDIAVDPARGAIANQVVSKNGSARRTSHQYVDGPSGASIRWSTTIQQSTPTANRSTSITLSNVTIDGQEVKP